MSCQNRSARLQVYRDLEGRGVSRVFEFPWAVHSGRSRDLSALEMKVEERRICRTSLWGSDSVSIVSQRFALYLHSYKVLDSLVKLFNIYIFSFSLLRVSWLASLMASTPSPMGQSHLVSGGFIALWSCAGHNAS